MRYLIAPNSLYDSFLGEWRRAYPAARLCAAPGLRQRRNPAVFAAHLAPLRRAEWVVYAKPPFGGPAAVLAYLARYTHRVAIANSRLLSLDDPAVRFPLEGYRTTDPATGREDRDNGAQPR